MTLPPVKSRKRPPVVRRPVLRKDFPVTKAPTPVPQKSLDEVYRHLKDVRESKTLALKPCSLLRADIKGPDGTLAPLRIRYYQTIGIYHLMTMARMVLGDNCGLGKTIEAIGALCYLWHLSPKQRVMVVAPKSTTGQWASEITRFTEGVTPFLVTTSGSSKVSSVDHRKAIYDAWLAHPGPAVLILNYDILVRDWNAEGYQPLLASGRPNPKAPIVPGILNGRTSGVAENLTVIFDEAAAFKNMGTKRWEICRFLSDRSKRVWGLTATLLKNRLEEGYAIFKCIRPSTFSTKKAFMDEYCHYQLKQMGRAKIPIITGYKNLAGFRARIDPFFLARQKHEVSTELPALTTREIPFQLSTIEDAKYAEALTGVLELGDGVVQDYTETRALTSLIYCQQVVNSLAMIKYAEGSDAGLDLWNADDRDSYKVGEKSSKETALLDLLLDELEGEKVVIYTRFASIVPRLQEMLKKVGITATRITGKDKDADRERAKAIFQDPDSDTLVIIITDAANEGVNLQTAAAMVFFDAPWSWGNYVQCLGRMLRIGSTKSAVVAYHLVANRANGHTTIDGHVLKMLRKKKEVIDQVIGEAAIGALEFNIKSDLRSLLESIQGDQ